MSNESKTDETLTLGAYSPFDGTPTTLEALLNLEEEPIDTPAPVPGSTEPPAPAKPKEGEDDDIVIPGLEIPKPGEGNEPPAPETPPATTPKGEEDEPPVTVPKGLDYKSVLASMMESNLMDTLDSIEVDGEQVPLAEVDIDEASFVEIVRQVMDESRNRVREEQEDGLSDFAKQLIKIEKSGGDVMKALEVYTKVLNPLKYIDLEDEADQIKVIQMDLKEKNVGDTIIQATIKGFKADGILQQEAEKSFQNQTEKANEQIKAQETAAIEKAKRDKEFIDNYKKELKGRFGELNVKDEFVKPFLDASTKINKENGTYAVDAKYHELRRDPKEAAELVMFLMNREAYLDMKMKETKIGTLRNVSSTIKLVKKAGGTSTVNNRKGDKDDVELNFNES